MSTVHRFQRRAFPEREREAMHQLLREGKPYPVEPLPGYRRRGWLSRFVGALGGILFVGSRKAL
jgi:hypothetical protein